MSRHPFWFLTVSLQGQDPSHTCLFNIKPSDISHNHRHPHPFLGRLRTWHLERTNARTEEDMGGGREPHGDRKAATLGTPHTCRTGLSKRQRWHCGSGISVSERTSWKPAPILADISIRPENIKKLKNKVLIWGVRKIMLERKLVVIYCAPHVGSEYHWQCHHKTDIEYWPNSNYDPTKSCHNTPWYLHIQILVRCTGSSPASQFYTEAGDTLTIRGGLDGGWAGTRRPVVVLGSNQSEYSTWNTVWLPPSLTLGVWKSHDLDKAVLPELLAVAPQCGGDKVGVWVRHSITHHTCSSTQCSQSRTATN